MSASGSGKDSQRANEQNQEKALSRRGFITGLGAGVVAGAVIGAGIGSLGFPQTVTQTVTQTRTTTSTATQSLSSNLVLNIPQTWDHQADAVVVGAGGAGLAAAIGACESGAKVILLEKAAEVGGTTTLSGGGIYAPGGTIELAAGIMRSMSDVLNYVNACGAGEQDEDLINAYLVQVNNWVAHLNSITSLNYGVSSTINSYNKPGALFAPGDRLADSNGAGTLGGAGLVKALKALVDGLGGTTMVSTPVTALYQDSTGKVVGVKATSNGSSVNISAAKGVILCAGGFGWNSDMVLNYLRGPIDITNEVSTNTGDGILMAAAVGAYLRNMNNCQNEAQYITPNGSQTGGQGSPGAIIVNKYGKRFADESADVGILNRTFHWFSSDPNIEDYINLPAYTITDSGHRSRYSLAGVPKGPNVPSWISQSNTLAGLATTLGIDPNGLEATVATFNQYAATGVDLDFHRGSDPPDIATGDKTRTDIINPCLAPLVTPPFYGLQIHPGMRNTMGGARHNQYGQVLDRFGNLIPGLYAAGNNSASLWGSAYPSGGASVGSATTFGWIAGKTAATSS